MTQVCRTKRREDSPVMAKQGDRKKGLTPSNRVEGANQGGCTTGKQVIHTVGGRCRSPIETPIAKVESNDYIQPLRGRRDEPTPRKRHSSCPRLHGNLNSKTGPRKTPGGEDRIRNRRKGKGSSKQRHSERKNMESKKEITTNRICIGGKTDTKLKSVFESGRLRRGGKQGVRQVAR